MKKAPNLKDHKKKNVEKILKNSSFSLQLKKFQRKIALLDTYCKTEAVFQQVEGAGCPRVVFLSLGNPDSRAQVFHAKGETMEEAWAAVVSKTEAYLQKNSFEVSYVKVDFVDAVRKVPLGLVEEQLRKVRKKFFRWGLALDGEFQHAFLEAELNTRQMFIYGEEGRISLENINKYLEKKKEPLLEKLPAEVVAFQCSGFFCDADDTIYPLYNRGLEYGRRKIDAFTREIVDDAVTSSAAQLSDMLQKNGEFQYGFRAHTAKPLSGYNMVRHIAVLWALLMEYSRSHEKKLKEKIDTALQYALKNAVEEINGLPYVIEQKTQEIKLGANAVVVITLAHYMEVTGDKRYLETACRFGESILSFADEKGDGYWHILSYPDGVKKEKYRIVYYDGEAALALTKLYGVTKEEKWLKAAQSFVDYFIEQDYTKYCDHWVGYSLNELTKYIPGEKYFAFALKNFENNRIKLYKGEITTPTWMELLISSFETYHRIKTTCPALPALKAFDEERFITTIYYRAQRMLDSYLYPEYAMYFKIPGPFLKSFAVRYDNFRVRIDDIQHFIGGFYHLLMDFDALEGYRKAFGIEPKDYLQLQQRYLK